MLRKDILKPLRTAGGSADPNEIARFNMLAQEWWKPDGKFRAAHAFNSARVAYIKQVLAPLGSQGAPQTLPLSGVRIIDVGCGAGLVSEPMAAAGASVVAIDAAAANVEVARRHAATAGIAIEYLVAQPDSIAVSGRTFDAVLCLEIVEHVADLSRFLADTASLLRPGGLLVIGTLNRTLWSWALAIIGAEYVLGWLPKGTHDWSRFVRPEELKTILGPLGLTECHRQGVVFNPFVWRWSLGSSTQVNYLMVFERPL